MKLLIFNSNSLRCGGGIEKWVLNLVPRLKKIGYEITILTSDSVGVNPELLNFNDLKNILGNNCKLFELPSWLVPKNRSPILNLSSYQLLKKKMKNADIVYSPITTFLQDIIVARAKLRTETPAIAGLHTSFFLESKRYNAYIKIVTRRVLKYFNACHVLNHYYKQLLNKWGLKHNFLLPNAIDIEKFKPYKHDWGQEFRVLYAGRLDKIKGIDILYKSITIFNKKFPNYNVKFLIVGSGDRKYQILMQDLRNKYPNVQYLGFIKPEKMSEIYEKCDLFVTPSKFENWPYSVLEAQSSGLPVIATEIPAHKEMIINDKSGSLVPLNNSEAIINRIIKFYRMWQDNLKKFELFKKNARREVERYYNWNRYINKLDKFLNYIAEKNPNKKN
ncbi:MAG: glycosyltransferase family 4 protein [Candidatus Helarchaeota archaeon]